MAAALVLVLAAAAWTIRRLSSKPQADPSQRTTRVVRGVLERTLRLTATTTTDNYATIAAPLMMGPDANRELVLIHLGEPGAMVKKGDVVARIDGKELADHVEDADAEVVQLQLEYERLQAEQSVALEAARQRLRAAKAALEQAKLSAQAAPVKTPTDRELLQIGVEEAQVEFQEAGRQIALIDDRQASERAQFQYRTKSRVHHRDRHKSDLQRFVLRAPINGQLVLRTLNRNGQTFQVRVGETVAPAQGFMRVVDLSNMSAEGTLSQTDSDIVRKGQKARIQFDAYPGLVVDGHVESVGQIATTRGRNSFFVRRIPVRISLDGSDPRIIPDLTVSADVVVGEEDDSLLIPRDAVQDSGGKSVVYVKQGEALLAREVELGGLGVTQVAVVSGLQEGEEVAVQREGPSAK